MCRRRSKASLVWNKEDCGIARQDAGQGQFGRLGASWSPGERTADADNTGSAEFDAYIVSDIVANAAFANAAGLKPN
jgi:hypothetical protein